MHAEVEKSPYVEPAWKRSTTLQALDSRCFYSTSSHYALCTWLAFFFCVLRLVPRAATILWCAVNDQDQQSITCSDGLLLCAFLLLRLQRIICQPIDIVAFRFRLLTRVGGCFGRAGDEARADDGAEDIGLAPGLPREDDETDEQSQLLITYCS